MEPLGIVVFSCIMGTAGFSVILEVLADVSLQHNHTTLGCLFEIQGSGFSVILRGALMVASSLCKQTCVEWLCRL